MLPSVFGESERLKASLDPNYTPREGSDYYESSSDSSPNSNSNQKAETDDTAESTSTNSNENKLPGPRSEEDAINGSGDDTNQAEDDQDGEFFDWTGFEEGDEEDNT